MPTVAPVRDRLRAWVDAGLIDAEQADAIQRFEEGGPAGPPPLAPLEGRTEPPARERRVPLLGEALGYLGAALVAIAGAILLSEQWDRLLYGAKLALIGLLGAVLFSAGAFVRDVVEPAAQRLTSYTWALTVAAVAWFAGVVVGRDGLAVAEETQALVVSVAATTVAAVLWRWRPRWQQHLVLAAGVVATVVSLLVQPATAPEPFFFGVAIVAVGLVWLLLGQADLLPPTAVARVVGMVLLVGGLRVLPSPPHERLGLVIALLATVAMLAVGVAAEVPLLLGFGAASVFLFVPQAVFEFFGETLGAPVALLIIGFVLIGTALLVVRARPGPEVPS